MKSTAAASTNQAEPVGLTYIVEASRKSAGLGSLSRASSFMALIALWLAAGPTAPSHSMPRHGFEVSTLSAGAGIVSRESAGIASRDLAGTSHSFFTKYRQQMEVDSERGSENKTVSTPFSMGTQSLALKKPV